MSIIYLKNSTIVLGFFAIILFQSSCAFTRIKRSKDITYQQKDTARNQQEMKLNVFAPKKIREPENVFVFIHGGNWMHGKRSLYNYFGSRMARKHIVMVVISYPLHPDADYKEMARASANALKWAKDNIKDYGGDPDKIFVSGHSAGGHLAALLGIDNEYFDELKMKNPVKGIVLIDAFGLDMYSYMKNIDYGPNNSYLSIFGKDPEGWKEASPIYHLHKKMPPMLIYMGEKTFPPIAKSNKRLIEKLKAMGQPPTYHLLKNKKHVGMITQFFNVYNPRYKEIIQFMETEKEVK